MRLAEARVGGVTVGLVYNNVLSFNNVNVSNDIRLTSSSSTPRQLQTMSTKPKRESFLHRLRRSSKQPPPAQDAQSSSSSHERKDSASVLTQTASTVGDGATTTAQDGTTTPNLKGPSGVDGNKLGVRAVRTSPVFRTARTIMGVARDALDGVPVPGLKGALGALLALIDTIERADQNLEDLEELAHAVLKLANVLARYQHQPNLPEPLWTRVDELSREISAISTSIKNKFDRGSFRRVVDGAGDMDDIARMFRDISAAIRRFMLGGLIQIEKDAGQAAADAKTLVNNSLLEKLPRALDASFESSDRDSCLAGTRQELLVQIFEWAENPHGHSIYWLNGMAGVGKTAIAQTVAQQLKSLSRLGASFFCARGNEDRSNVRNIFPTIAYGLAQAYPSFCASLLKAVAQDPDVGRFSAFQQFTKLIAEPSHGLPAGPHPIIVVIDALDECTDLAATRNAIKILCDHAPSLPMLHFFITSRPESQIWLDSDISTIQYLHDVEEDIVVSDIRHYLTVKLGDIPASRNLLQDFPENWPAASDIEVLVARAGRLFIYAFTVYQFIASLDANPQERLIQLLKAPTSQSDIWDEPIDDLYTQILSLAFETRRLTAAESKINHDVLNTVLLAFDPQTAKCLAELLGLEQHQISTSIQRFHSVIHIPKVKDNPITIFHASFFDYMVDAKRSKHFHLDAPAHHTFLASTCLNYMNKHLHQNLCNLDGRPLLHDITNRMDVPDALQYACVYWTRHLVAGAITPENVDYVQAAIESFFKTHLLHWIECLSLIGQLDTAVASIANMFTFMKAHEDIDSKLDLSVVQLMLDAERFLWQFMDVIETAPMDIYHSALLWTPTRTELYKHYTTNIPDGPLKIICGVTAYWGPCLRTFVEHSQWVSAVAFSDDGTRVVSGSWDRWIVMWDANTGMLQGMFGGHRDRINSVAFSHDGSRVVSGSWDKTVRIWNLSSGMHTQVLAGHDDQVTSVLFSQDDTKIVSGSWDKTIRIWDVATGNVINVLERHSDMVHSISLSSDGTKVVSGSDDNIIRIWNIITGHLEGILEGHTDIVHSVAFSPDGTKIVSGSYDKTVRIWNAKTGEYEKMLVGHHDWVNAVAFSADSRKVVSASDDNTIRTWEVSTGRAESILVGHSDRVYSVAFSSDGTRIVSGSWDKTVRIWDAHGGSAGYPVINQTMPAEGHPRWVRSMAFSQDGKRVVSGTSENTILVWDTDTGTVVSVLKGHTRSVNSVALSPDGHRVVSGSLDHSICIWDTNTGKVLKRLEGNWPKVISLIVAFSDDGKKILLQTEKGKTFQVWDPVADTVQNTESHVRVQTVPLFFLTEDDYLPSTQIQPKYSLREDWLVESSNNTRLLWIPFANCGDLMETHISEGGHLVRICLVNPSGLITIIKLDL
ncbi:hypothetical protein PLICRDRAFT_151028 [Plicaturopsis crispa FD-325 SS-3]|nr:hypothetical protein PLICRDRAFT_151028 [Plicaturopsis crispa FD-325 SS-3]